MNDQRAVVAVVDDDLRMLDALEALFESAGISVRRYPSAPALLDDDALGTIDCLVTDIGLPGMDGFALERLARAAVPGLPVILITGGDGVPSGQLANEPPKSEIFQKPFDSSALLSRVIQVIGLRNRGDAYDR